MKYIALIYSTPDAGPQPEDADFGAYMNRWREITETYTKDGVFVAGEALQPVETATSIRVKAGKTELTDGPFAETKETLGGFYMFDCESLDDAIRYAKMIPTVEHGVVELRPVLEIE